MVMIMHEDVYEDDHECYPSSGYYELQKYLENGEDRHPSYQSFKLLVFQTLCQLEQLMFVNAMHIRRTEWNWRQNLDFLGPQGIKSDNFGQKVE